METSNWPPMERMGPPVTGNAVASFEADIGAQLPDDYRDFLLTVNGGRTAAMAVTFKVRKDESTLNTLLSLNDADKSHDLATNYERFKKREKLPNLLPIGADDGGSTLFIPLEGQHRAQVWMLDVLNQRSDESNPRVLWHDRRDMIRIADNFRAFMSSLTPL